MRILIIAATELELSDIRPHLSRIPKNVSLNYKVTNIGCLQTCYHLFDSLIKNKYHFVLQIGIAGSLDENIPIGSICQVISEQLGDLGSEDANGALIDALELGLMNNTDFPFTNGTIVNEFTLPIKELYPVAGCTVNKTSGNTQNINRFKRKYPDCQIENMEGAAIFYVCKNMNIPFMEIRSISNMVEERNKDNWNIKLALSVLEDNIEQIVLEILKHYQ